MCNSTNQILALCTIHRRSVDGPEKIFSDSGKKFLQPMLSGCNFIVRLDGSFYINRAILFVCRLLYSPSCCCRVLDHVQRQDIILGKNICRVRVCIRYDSWYHGLLEISWDAVATSLSCDTSYFCTSPYVGKITHKQFPQKYIHCTSLRSILLHDFVLFSILHTSVPAPKTPLVTKLLRRLVSTMASSGFGPYHGQWHDEAPTKCIGTIPTP